jgi:hypothetical protein
MNRSYSKIRHIQEANERLEKRLMNEQSSQTVTRTHANSQLVDKVFADIKSAMSGLGTDEDKVLSALYKLSPNTSGAGWDANVAQKRKDYEYLLELLRKEGFKDLKSWISGEIAPHHATNPDAISKAIGLDKAYENDKEIGDAVRKLEDLLSGRTNYL